ncbi:mCG16301, isoform CRA_d, partial [Mus musculus]
GIEFPNVRGPSPALLPPFSPWQRPGTCAPRSYSEASSPWSAPPSIPSTSGPLCGWRNTILLVSFIFKLAAHMTMASKEQAVNRAGIVQEDVQPPGLKVWSDPFGRK